jgi:2-keto-4-pentenoate hydratase/2-oxohepta-3-ene-1,7-dioic acid hydratase in catechol pathway
MKFLTYFDADNRERVGVLHNGAAHDLAALGFPHADMPALIAGYTPALGADIAAKAAAAGQGIPAGDVRLQAPIPRPRHDILCIGQNYLAHALEAARYLGKEYVKPTHPTYFSKRVGLPVGHGGVIPAHADVTAKLDYEAELAVVIGKRMDHVPPENVFEHVFGYTIVNDVSARDRQMDHTQFTYGKGMDGFAPMGPWIVTADEFAAPPHLDIKTRVNGELRQDSNTSDFIFDIPYLLAELSRAMVLEPGDILITGTPSGVGLGFVPPKFLRPGDVVECEIEGIGMLRNTVVE